MSEPVNLPENRSVTEKIIDPNKDVVDLERGRDKLFLALPYYPMGNMFSYMSQFQTLDSSLSIEFFYRPATSSNNSDLDVLYKTEDNLDIYPFNIISFLLKEKKEKSKVYLIGDEYKPLELKYLIETDKIDKEAKIYLLTKFLSARKKLVFALPVSENNLPF